MGVARDRRELGTSRTDTDGGRGGERSDIYNGVKIKNVIAEES